MRFFLVLIHSKPQTHKHNIFTFGIIYTSVIAYIYIHISTVPEIALEMGCRSHPYGKFWNSPKHLKPQ